MNQGEPIRKCTSLATARVRGLVGIFAAGASDASPIAFSTASSATVGGNPVSASATFTLSTNSLQIVLTDTQADPKTVAQLVQRAERLARQ